MKVLANKWFADIPSRDINKCKIPIEEKQLKARELTVDRNVPFDAIYKAYHMGSKLSNDFYATDMISDLLSNGKSARLYQRLVKEKKLFSEINAYITGDIDPGLVVISGKTIKGIGLDKANEAINEELENLKTQAPSDYELEKVKNKFESIQLFTQSGALHKAMDLAYHELLGDADRINQEVKKYRKVTKEDILRVSNDIFTESNCSTLYYKAIQ